MVKIEQIVGIKNAMESTTSVMRGVFDQLSAEIARLQADGSRHPDWVREQVGAARGRALAQLGPLMKSLSEQAASVSAQRRFLESRTLGLMGQRFDTDAAKDAMIRLHHQAELSALGPEELQLVADHARVAGDLPTLWQAHLAGRRHVGEKGWPTIDISSTTIPGQAESLQNINACEALVAAGELIVGQTSGRLSATEKLRLGRQIAQPNEGGQQIGYGRPQPETVSENA